VQSHEVNDRVDSSPQRDSIIYRGYVDHPGDAYAEVDVLMVPSITDGRPAAVMEANASGIPVLANPVGGIPELISDGVNGYLVAPTEPDRIAELLSSWRREPATFGQLRSSTRALAESRFDRDRMMDGYAVAFAEWIETPARPLAVLQEPLIPESMTIPDPRLPRELS
jgi:glycosyltransferase involved in cell wall biosynthesis